MFFRNKINSAAFGFFLFFVSHVLLSCGSSIKNAQDFIPNNAPVLTRFDVSDLAGNPLDQKNIVDNMQVLVTVEAYDPEGQELTYDFFSDKGSFSGRNVTVSGCTIYCFTKSVDGGKDVDIGLSVRDKKNASVTVSRNLGTGKLGPELTISGFGSAAITSSEVSTLTFSCTCDGYYRIVETDSIASDADAKAQKGSIYQYAASTDVSTLENAQLLVSGAGSISSPNLRLSTGEGTKKVWVIFWDGMNRYIYRSVSIVVDDTPPQVASHVPGTGEKGIPASTDITITFSDNDDIDQETLENALSIMPSEGIIIKSPVYSGKTASYPVSGFAENIIYTAALAPTVADRAGNKLNTLTNSNSFRFSRNLSLVTGVSLNYLSVVRNTGSEDLELNAEVTPDGANGAVLWLSDNPSIAGVDSDGVVIFKNAGKVRITATTVDGGYTATCDIRVDPKIVLTAAVSGTVSTYSMPSGYTFSTVATPSLPAGAVFPTGKNDDTFLSVPLSVEIGTTEATYQIWSDVYSWACSPVGGKRADGGPLYSFAHKGSGSVGFPVSDISWSDAMVWCNALTEYYNTMNGEARDFECVYTYNGQVIREATDANVLSILFAVQNPAAKGFRLPAGTEWEFAARYIGSSLPSHSNYIFKDGYYYSKGSSASGAAASVSTSESTTSGPTSLVAWFKENSNAKKAVASKSANSLGLYDMNGNVWEWVFDWDASYPYTKKNQRGGSYGDSITDSGQYVKLMIYYKDSVFYSTSWGSFGFRFCKNL